MGNVKVLTVISSRGGNSKTITSLFLAVSAAKRGIKTVLVDADLEAPSLQHMLLRTSVTPSWIDFLGSDKYTISQVINKSQIKNLDVIFSPPPQIGKSFLDWKTHDWWTNALKRSMLAKIELEKLGYQLIIIDSQSGTSYNTLNNLAFSDISIMVLRPAGYGLGATEGILSEIFSTLKGMRERKDYFLWTQVYRGNNEKEKLLMGKFFEKWDKRLDELGLKLLGQIPFDNELYLSLLMDKIDLNHLNSNIQRLYDEIFDKVC